MMHKSLYRMAAVAVAFVAWLGCGATIPEGYYNSLDAKSGKALKNAVHDLLIQHTVLNYNSLWYYFPETDCWPDDSSRVWDMYSDRYYTFRNHSGMHKEHSLPKSWWGVSDANENTDLYPSFTDIMHLYPSDGEANMAKLNYPLGEVSKATFDNGVTKVGYPVSGQGGGASEVFEPDDRYKGDFARTYFYMACCYQHYDWRITYMLNSSTWKTLNNWSIDLLCRWARNDAVSDKEVDRNDAVQKFQNNRNPFIDLPELFEYIWGSKQDEIFYLNGAGADTTYKGDPQLISPVQGSVLDFGEVAIGKSLDYTLYVKGLGLTNKLSVMVYRDDSEMFSIPVSSIERTAANSAQGYPLKITYTPTSVGEHTARLLVSDGGLTGSIGVELRARCAEVPTLSRLTALPATGITDSTYVANWRAADDEQVDYYIITRSIYDANGTMVRTETFTTDGSDATSYQFTDRRPGEIHTYYVQSSRLGYLSEPSNVITLDASGITGIDANKPLQVLAIEGGILVKCSENVGSADIYNIAGQHVCHIDALTDDMVINLPRGIYLLRTATSRMAWKVAVK